MPFRFRRSAMRPRHGHGSSPGFTSQRTRRIMARRIRTGGDSVGDAQGGDLRKSQHVRQGSGPRDPAVAAARVRRQPGIGYPHADTTRRAGTANIPAAGLLRLGLGLRLRVLAIMIPPIPSSISSNTTSSGRRVPPSGGDGASEDLSDFFTREPLWA